MIDFLFFLGKNQLPKDKIIYKYFYLKKNEKPKHSNLNRPLFMHRNARNKQINGKSFEKRESTDYLVCVEGSQFFGNAYQI